VSEDDIYDIPYGEAFSLPPGVLQIVQDDAEGVDWGLYPPEGWEDRYGALRAARGLYLAVVVGVIFWVVFIAGLIAIYRWVFA
jgi:hypothetical protein